MKVRRTALMGLVVAATLQPLTGAEAATSAPAFATVGSYTITPTPVAATGVLVPGQTVALTVTALTTARKPDAFAYVWIRGLARLPNGHATQTLVGQFTVNGTALDYTSSGVKYQVNGQGQLSITYKAGAEDEAGYQDGIWAKRYSGPQSGANTMDWYQY